MPRSFLIKQKAVKKYSRDQCCYPDCVPYFFPEDASNSLHSPQFDYEKFYEMETKRDTHQFDDHQFSDKETMIWKARHPNLFEGPYEHRPTGIAPTPTTPPTPSMFHENHWITQSTLFPFAFHDFERKPREGAADVDSMDQNKLECVNCKKEFESRASLEEHVKSSHGSSSRSYTCQFCNKSFSRSWNFQRHVLIHKGEKPHKCEKCPKAFVLAAHLKIHNRIHTGEKPYKCNVCSRGFAQLTNLQRHVLTHTGQKPHKCTYCPKGFVSSSDLRRHVRTHTGEKPYKCKSCPKAFTTSGNLHSHMLTHTGEKPYQCKICKWKFISSSNLRTHCRIHHKRPT